MIPAASITRFPTDKKQVFLDVKVTLHMCLVVTSLHLPESNSDTQLQFDRVFYSVGLTSGGGIWKVIQYHVEKGPVKHIMKQTRAIDYLWQNFTLVYEINIESSKSNK